MQNLILMCACALTKSLDPQSVRNLSVNVFLSIGFFPISKCLELSYWGSPGPGRDHCAVLPKIPESCSKSNLVLEIQAEIVFERSEVGSCFAGGQGHCRLGSGDPSKFKYGRRLLENNKMEWVTGDSNTWLIHEFELVEAQYKYGNIMTLARGEASRQRRSIWQKKKQ
jgi:hypothetical protein